MLLCKTRLTGKIQVRAYQNGLMISIEPSIKLAPRSGPKGNENMFRNILIRDNPYPAAVISEIIT